MQRRPPEPLVFFLDENIDGPDLAERLRSRGIRHEAHRIHFTAGATDEEWIPVVAARGWVIVTRDLEIRRRAVERDAWLHSGAIVVMLRGDSLNNEAMASALSAALARGLELYVSKRMPPMILYLWPDGRYHVKEGGVKRAALKRDS